MQTRQSSGAVGNDEGKDAGDCSPRAPSPMSMTVTTTASMTSTASPTSIVPTGSTDLQHRRRRQQQQQLSLMQTMDSTTVASSSSTCDEPSRLSANVLFSLPTSPKRSSASHFSSTKAPAISKSQMKGESRLKASHLLITLRGLFTRSAQAVSLRSHVRFSAYSRIICLVPEIIPLFIVEAW